MTKRYYAVYPGKKPGVYREWSAASAASSGHHNEKHPGFNSREEALNWYIMAISEVSLKKTQIQPVWTLDK